MSFGERLKGAVIAIVVCILSAPIAVGITIALLPLWRWVEATFGVESVGHSGPAGWCYLATYIVFLICVAFIWHAAMRRAMRVK